MEKKVLKKKNKLKNLSVSLAIGIAILLALAFYLEKSIEDSGFGGSLNTSKYESAINRVQSLIGSYKTDFFERGDFNILKSFITLPLEKGRPGNNNPFKSQLTPEKMLLKPLL